MNTPYEFDCWLPHFVPCSQRLHRFIRIKGARNESGIDNADRPPRYMKDDTKLWSIAQSKVQMALDDPRWDFRTIEGIAKETGLTCEQVRVIVRTNPQLVRKSAVPDRQGRTLLANRLKRIQLREILSIWQRTLKEGDWS